MKKLFLASIAMVTLSAGGSALAADMRPVYKAPPPVVVYDPWTGFYVGANGGSSWSKWDSTSLTQSSLLPTVLARRQARTAKVGSAAYKPATIGASIPAGWWDLRATS